MPQYTPPAFLTELLHARSPSGYEREAQEVFDRHVRPFADAYTGDALGNRIATLNPEGDPTLMLAGHMDELGLIITYVNKEGFLYFDTIGGHDRTVISGRRVIIQTEKGPVKGVTGKRAIHLMDEADRKKVPETTPGRIAAPRQADRWSHELLKTGLSNFGDEIGSRGR